MKFYKVTTVTVENATHITHPGTFHADEVMATAILSALKPVKLCRTARVPEGTEALVFDVGFGPYDHHQRGGNGSRENDVPYAAAGLIWRDFGRRLVPCDEAWDIVDRELIQGIDASDNGVFPAVAYPAQAATISKLISGFNPNWDSEESPDAAFLEAVEFAQGVLARAIAAAESKARAKTLADEAIKASKGRVIRLPRFFPWQEYVTASAAAASALFVVYPDKLRPGEFAVQAIPEKYGSFKSRKPLPEDWWGKTGDALVTACGVAGAIFCHPNGFMAKASSEAAALALANKAVEA